MNLSAFYRGWLAAWHGQPNLSEPSWNPRKLREKDRTYSQMYCESYRYGWRSFHRLRVRAHDEKWHLLRALL